MQPDNQPGTPIQPVQPVQPQSAPQSAPQQPLQQQPQPLPQQPTPPVQQAPVAPQAQAVAPEAIGSVAVADQIEGGYGFETADEEGDDYYEEGEIDLSEPVSWDAQEYLHHEKGVKWFLAFAVVIIALLALAIFVMQSYTFAALLVVIAVLIIILSKRPPRIMHYQLSNDGLHIGETLHAFSEFKSFGVIHDGQEYSIMLIPRRRFMPGVTVYFPEEAGEDIVDALGSRMPMRDLHLDVVDRIVRKLRL